LEDPEKNLFICENIWEAKQIIDEDTKLAQLAITLRDRALDWYMSLEKTVHQDQLERLEISKNDPDYFRHEMRAEI
jgi:hypothetical protein